MGSKLHESEIEIILYIKLYLNRFAFVWIVQHNIADQFDN